MLRVAIISTLPPQRTGESPYTVTLIEHLLQYEDIEIIAIGGPDSYPIEDERVRVVPIWRGRSLCYPIVLADYLKRERPHLVHVQFGPHGEVFGGLFGEPMLVLLTLLRSMGIKTTVTLHSTWMPEQVVERVKTYPRLRRFAFLADPMFKLYMRLLDLGADTIQLSTVTTRSLLRKRFLGEYEFDPETTLEIPHPCRPDVRRMDQFEAKEEIGLKGRKILLVFGYLRPGKGIEIAVRAMREVSDLIPDAILIIAGQTQGSQGQAYLRQLENLVEESSLERYVRIDEGFVPDEMVPIYFSAASIILAPYTESVGASGPLHNQAAYGTPVIAADAGYHMREALGGNVRLFEEGSHESLAQAIIEILREDDLATALGEKIREYARSETWETAARRTMNHYRKTLKLRD